MARSYSRIGIALFSVFFIALFISGTTTTVHAQSFGDDWIEDDKLHVLIEFNNRNIKTATETNPIPINRNGTTPIFLSLNVTNDVALNISGVITFYYQGFAVLPIQLATVVDGNYLSYVVIEANEGIAESYDFPLADYLSLQNATGIDLDLVTGIYEVSLDFHYKEIDTSDPARSAVPHIVSWRSYFELPLENPLDAVFTVFGAITAVSTVSAVGTLGFNFKSIFEAIQTAHKARSIQKKTGEIRSLPNLLVIGALPALFSMLAGMVKVKKKKKKKDDVETPEPDAISEYRLRQRIRETAPPAWRVDRCPKCKRDWHKKTNTCKKCKIGEEEARDEYAEYLSTKTEKAIKVVGKNKSISIQKLAKKIKTNDYNAGVIGAAMVDTEVTEIQKIDTPFKSFIMNIGGLVFLILTWQQLLGGAASQFQTTLTFVGAGLSLAVIVALYIARKTQIEKLHAEVDAGGKIMPTDEELKEADDDDVVPPSQEVADEETPVEDMDEPVEEPVESTTDYEDLSDDSEATSEDATLDLEEKESEWSEDEELDSDSLTPEELDRERK
jgi:hypothetical protein